MSDLWLTSDLHLGDEWAAKLRYGKQNVAHHEQWLADAWDTCVRPGDQVWVLGDVSPQWPIGQIKDWLDARPGDKHLVLGNWDEKYTQPAWRTLGGFTTVRGPGVLLYEDGITVGLTHKPQAVTGDGVRATLHGHTHVKKQKAHRDSRNRLLIHIGWDAWRKPVRWEQVVEIIEEEKWS